MSQEKERTSISEYQVGRGTRIFSVITTVILALSVLLCGSVIIQGKTKGYASVFGYSVFCVVTGSMEPTLPEGGFVLCKNVDFDDVHIYDIICFQSLESYMRGQMVTHRVIEIIERNGTKVFRTRGDANNSEDGFYVTPDNFIGRVVAHTDESSFVTTLYKLLTSKTGFFTLIGIPMILIISIVLWDNLKKIKVSMAQMKKELKELESGEKKDNGGNEEKITSDRKGPAAETAEILLEKASSAANGAEEKDSAQTAKATTAEISSEEYRKMVEQIRAELLAEMQKSAPTEEVVSEEREGTLQENVDTEDISPEEDNGEDVTSTAKEDSRTEESDGLPISEEKEEK